MSEFADFSLQLDLTAVQEFDGNGGAPSLPQGDYVFDVIDMKQGTSKNNQPKLEVIFEVVEPEEHAGKRISNNYSLQNQALGRIKALGMACGAALTGINRAEYVGSRIRASVVHSEGAATVGPDGTPRAARTFANVAAERPLEQAQTQPTKAPPITRGAATTGKPTNGAPVRRA